MNRLLDDPDQEAIVTGMLTGASFQISAYNVIEAAKTKNVSRRLDVVRLMRRLADNKRPLDLPNSLIRATVRAYAKGEMTTQANADPNLEGLWTALNEPELIDDSAQAEAFAWAEKWEGDYDAIAVGSRDEFQKLVRLDPDQRPRTPAETIRLFMRHGDQIFSQIVSPVYEEVTGRRLSKPEYDELMMEPMWALYLGGYGYALHQRAVSVTGFSQARNAGGIDLSQAVYLRLCDRFVTNDRAQHRGLRFLNRFNRAAGQTTEVWTYDSFRSRLLILG